MVKSCLQSFELLSRLLDQHQHPKVALASQPLQLDALSLGGCSGTARLEYPAKASHRASVAHQVPEDPRQREFSKKVAHNLAE